MSSPPTRKEEGVDSTTKNATVVILAFFALAAFASGLLAAVDWNLFLAMKIITGFFVAVNVLIFVAVAAKRIWTRRQLKFFKKKCEDRDKELEPLFEERRNAQERIDTHRREVLGIPDEEWEKQKEA